MPSRYAIGEEVDETGRALRAVRRRDRHEPEPRPGRGLPAAALLLAAAALAISVAAAVVALTRPSAADPSSCRSSAWNAIPAIGDLPSGWSLNGTSLDADGYSTALVGPTASAASAPPDSIFAKLACFGADAHAAFTRSETLAKTSGMSEISFAAIGDESFAAANADGSGTAFVRRGSLLATLGSSSGVSPADFEQAARAIDAAMASAQGGRPAPTTAALPSSGGPAPSSGESGSPGQSGSGAESGSPGESASPGSAPQHAAPDLEALLPHAVNGTRLETQSTDGAAGLGNDASSKSLVASLQALGKKASQLQIALAYDPTGALDINLLAFRVAGVDGPTLKQQVLKSWLAGAGSGIQTSTVTLGGKQVTRVDYGDGGTRDYVYEHGSVVIDVASSDDKLAAQVLAALP